MSTATIALVIDKDEVNSLANTCHENEMSPVQAAMHVASTPLAFNSDRGYHTVKNLESGEITENYRAGIQKIFVEDGELIYLMKNGDVLNGTKSMRELSAAVLARMLDLLFVDHIANSTRRGM